MVFIGRERTHCATDTAEGRVLVALEATSKVRPQTLFIPDINADVTFAQFFFFFSDCTVILREA